MESKDKISKFAYFPFLKQLISKGKFQWKTPSNSGKEVFVTTLYLDGDMLCWFIEDEYNKLPDNSPEIFDSHIQKINHDLSSISTLSNQLSLGVGILVAALTFIFNPSAWLENILILGSVSIIGFLGRNIIRKILFKIVGIIAGRFFKQT